MKTCKSCGARATIGSAVAKENVCIGCWLMVLDATNVERAHEAARLFYEGDWPAGRWEEATYDTPTFWRGGGMH